MSQFPVHVFFLAIFLVAGLVPLSFPRMLRADWPSPISNEEAWKMLPPSDGARTEALPVWARMMVSVMPRTTAAYLELDRAQRTLGAVPPGLRAACRFVTAKTNGCEYSQASARADGKLANVASEKWASLEDESWKDWSADERSALEFAKRMAVDSDEIPDAFFSNLVAKFGEQAAACMVLHSAYANFQDRFLLCLQITTDSSSGLPPVTARFDPKGLASTTTPPPPKPSADSQTEAHPTTAIAKTPIKKRMEYTWLPFEALQQRLENQRQRTTRLPIPEWDVIAPKLPAGLMDKPSAIVWYRIAFGYAAELAVPFEIYMRTAGSEISMNWDRIFGNSIFWIVTDAMKCPYCMGHCEMNWEVAGLETAAIAKRSRILAGDDWTDFTPEEQSALSFARKLTKTPMQITKDDIQILRDGFGDQRALFIMLNASRYNYMTRISNGFQLTLESENVFWDYYNMTPKSK